MYRSIFLHVQRITGRTRGGGVMIENVPRTEAAARRYMERRRVPVAGPGIAVGGRPFGPGGRV